MNFINVSIPAGGTLQILASKVVGVVDRPGNQVPTLLLLDGVGYVAVLTDAATVKANLGWN